jgi:hypothetical protein
MRCTLLDLEKLAFPLCLRKDPNPNLELVIDWYLMAMKFPMNHLGLIRITFLTSVYCLYSTLNRKQEQKLYRTFEKAIVFSNLLLLVLFLATLI